MSYNKSLYYKKKRIHPEIDVAWEQYHMTSETGYGR